MRADLILNKNDETGEDDKVDEFEKCVWVPEELKSVLGCRGTLVSLRLPRIGGSLKLPRYSGHP